MSLIRPFAGLRPLPQRAHEVIAPPYDVLSSDEARGRAAGKPWSFLHISKPEIDLPAGIDPYAPAVYAQGVTNLRRMLASGVLLRDPSPYYYVYRLRMGEHVQTGVVAAASVAAYDANRIRRHELTRPEKEDDRVRQIDALNAQTGPVLLAHAGAPALAEVLAAVAAAPAECDVVADDGISHQLWVVRDPAAIAAIAAAVEAMSALYIADGHHRSAAASRVAAARRADGRASDAGSEGFLAVLFPAAELKILDYNRVVRDLAGCDADEFLRRVGERFAVTAVGAPLGPTRAGEFGMYLAGRWYRLILDPRRIPTDPVARLDVSLLSDQLLAPVLGVHDLRRDARIDFVGGMRGLGELARRVDSGEMAVAFAMHATTMEDLMAVADAGEIMPPKSTWFEPKLADGMVSHLLD